MENTYTIEIDTTEIDITIEAPDETYSLTIEEPVIEIIEVCVQGPPGPPGDASAEIRFIAGESLGGHRAVVTSNYDTVIYANNSIDWHGYSYVGITTQSANIGQQVNVKVNGEIMENSWSWVIHEPIYFTTNGTLTQTVPTNGAFSKIIAIANSTNSILLLNEDAIFF